MRGSSVRFWWEKGCMTCVSGGRNTFTVSSHNLRGNIDRASIMLPTWQQSRSQTIFQTLPKAEGSDWFSEQHFLSHGAWFMHKKYHNHILHSGLELSNGLDCYGSQKLRQLRVRTYSTSNLAQTTITHVICNLIQALKSENNLVPCGKSHSKHQTTHVRGSWHETSIHTLFYNVDTCRPGHTHALPGLFRIMHTLSPLNI